MVVNLRFSSIHKANLIFDDTTESAAIRFGLSDKFLNNDNENDKDEDDVEKGYLYRIYWRNSRKILIFFLSDYNNHNTQKHFYSSFNFTVWEICLLKLSDHDI